MPNVNKVIILGHLGKDPETRSFSNGDQVVNFSVATSKKWKDKQTGEDKQQTTWHYVVAYRNLAAVCAKYLRKGDAVYIEGSLKTDEYKDKNDIDRKITKIVMENMQLLSNKRADDINEAKQMSNRSSEPRETFSDDIPF